MYHLQLRQFPHNVCRFNLTEAQLRPVIEPWANDRWVEFGERKWSPHQAKLTILDGPELAVQELSMGRGWRNAERSGRDVTRELLEAMRRAEGAEDGAAEAIDASASAVTAPAPAAKAGGAAATSQSSPVVARLADSLALELLARLENGPISLFDAWRLAQAQVPGRTASDSLALAESAMASLLRRRLVLLVSDGDRKASEPSGGASAGDADEQALRSPDSWLPGDRPGAVHVRRA